MGAVGSIGMSKGCFGLFRVIVVGCMGLVVWGWFNRVRSMGFFFG